MSQMRKTSLNEFVKEKLLTSCYYLGAYVVHVWSKKDEITTKNFYCNKYIKYFFCLRCLSDLTSCSKFSLFQFSIGLE